MSKKIMILVFASITITIGLVIWGMYDYLNCKKFKQIETVCGRCASYATTFYYFNGRMMPMQNCIDWENYPCIKNVCVDK